MAVIEMFTWWYSKGWSVFIHMIREKLAGISDFFSMDSLVRTLFQPFRQISAESASTNSSINLKFRMFTDRLVSRVVGFFSRFILLIIGTVVIVIGGVLSLVLIVLWPVIPLAPITGIILAVTGFTI